MGEIIQMADGTMDAKCSAYHNDTACTHLIAHGWRWIVWPELKRCCKCCSFEKDCGPLAPTWLQNRTGNMFYAGIVNVTAGDSTFQCKKWVILGLSGWVDPNYYLEHVPLQDGQPGQPCEIHGSNHPGADQYRFFPETFSTIVPHDLFTLPDFCEDDSYCDAPVCDRTSSAMLFA